MNMMIESHPALRECISDLEIVRQQVVHQARMIMEYHISCTNDQFQAEIAGLEDDYLVCMILKSKACLIGSQL